MHSINLTSDSYSVECKTGLSSITFNETSPIEEKKQKDKKKRVNRKIVCLYCDSVDILILTVNIIIMILYMGSLLPCGSFKGTYKCVWFFNKGFFGLIGGKIFFSSLLTSFLLSCFIYANKYYWHCSYMIAFYLFFFINFDGTKYSNHGIYNTLLFILFFSFFMSVFGIGLFISWLYRKKHYLILYLLSIGLVMTYILYHNNKILNFSCEKWDYGLNNTRINNIR